MKRPSREDQEELGRIVHEILRLVIGLQSGTVESARELADGAKLLSERLERLRRPQEENSGLTTENVDKMAVPGRVRIDSYAKGVMRQLRGNPTRRPDSFPPALVGQRRKARPIDPKPLEQAARRAMEQRREDIVKRSRATPSHRGTPRERAEASEALEKSLLNQLLEQRGRRLDLLGRRIGA